MVEAIEGEHEIGETGLVIRWVEVIYTKVMQVVQVDILKVEVVRRQGLGNIKRDHLNARIISYFVIQIKNHPKFLRVNTVVSQAEVKVNNIYNEINSFKRQEI